MNMMKYPLIGHLYCLFISTNAGFCLYFKRRLCQLDYNAVMYVLGKYKDKNCGSDVYWYPIDTFWGVRERVDLLEKVIRVYREKPKEEPLNPYDWPIS